MILPIILKRMATFVLKPHDILLTMVVPPPQKLPPDNIEFIPSRVHVLGNLGSEDFFF